MHWYETMLNALSNDAPHDPSSAAHMWFWLLLHCVFSLVLDTCVDHDQSSTACATLSKLMCIQSFPLAATQKMINSGMLERPESYWQKWLSNGVWTLTILACWPPTTRFVRCQQVQNHPCSKQNSCHVQKHIEVLIIARQFSLSRRQARWFHLDKREARVQVKSIQQSIAQKVSSLQKNKLQQDHTQLCILWTWRQA